MDCIKRSIEDFVKSSEKILLKSGERTESLTPHEYDLMMNEPALDIIVPELMKDLGIAVETER